MQTQSPPLSSQPLTIQALWVILHVRWSIPVAIALGDRSRFLAGNREVELKPTTFSSLLHFRVFLSLLFSYPSTDILLSSAAFWGHYYYYYYY